MNNLNCLVDHKNNPCNCFMTDKYNLSPGETDSIDCLRKERDELKGKLEVLVKALKIIEHIPDIPDYDSDLVSQVNEMCREANDALGKIKDWGGK